jgi:hypothetical protein
MFDSHADMVQKLAKPGAAVLAELTPDGAHLWHMATGVAGEAGELLAAVICNPVDAPDIENIKEELGDLEFYLEGIRSKLAINFDTQIKPLADSCHVPQDLSRSYTKIVVYSSDILDRIKKAVIYSKPISSNYIIESMTSLELEFRLIRNNFGWTRQDILDANVAKLGNRYSSGTYSNQQAQDRADKVELETESRVES